MNCQHCQKPLPVNNHVGVHVRCSSAFKAAERNRCDAEVILRRKVREESSLLPWERHPIPWDHVRQAVPQ